MTTLVITRPDDWHLHLRDDQMLRSVLPHTADEAHRALWRDEEAPSVHRLTFAAPPEVEIDEAWPAVLAAREEALRALEAAKAEGIENPLDAEVIVPDPDGVLARFEGDFADMLGRDFVHACCYVVPALVEATQRRCPGCGVIKARLARDPLDAPQDVQPGPRQRHVMRAAVLSPVRRQAPCVAVDLGFGHADNLAQPLPR